MRGFFRYTESMETGLSPLFSLKKEDPFMTEMEFAERLKRFRKAKNLTQQELADQLGVSNKSVSRWESGGGYPDVALLAPLARALGVTVDALLCDDPPIRTLDTADWQNLLSFAFAIGGGVLFFLLDLFIPTLACYLLYLGAMAYGVYLQNRYTYHSRWFRLANLTMNFFVCFQLTAGVAQLILAQWYAGSLAAGDLLFATIDTGLLSGLTLPLILLTSGRALAAALLTALTDLVIRALSAGQRPRLSWGGQISPWEISLCVLFLLPLLFWVAYRTLYLPELLYRYQNLTYVLLTVLCCLACCLILRRKEHPVLPLALLLFLAMSTALWFLADRSACWSVSSQQILTTDTVSDRYLRFGQFIWPMVPWTVLCPAAYLLLRRIRINLSNITSL